MDRRNAIKSFGALPLIAPIVAASTSAAASAADRSGSAVITLPDRANFPIEGIFLDAAYTHPMSIRAAEASRRYSASRLHDARRRWPLDNDRDRAVALYAKLINADPSEIAIVPSTLEGENLIGAAVGIGPGAGVLTDVLHQSSMLALYGEKHKNGMPLVTLQPTEWKIDYDELDRALTPDIKLIAVSWISSSTGYKHDLKRLCEIAHRKGVLVYADVIQGVGAVPLDVRDSGVDFCCAGMYKWLMGDFGSAFLYVRADRLRSLQRVQLGWRGVQSYKPFTYPYDAAPDLGNWKLGTDTASIFEVSTPNWNALSVAADSLDYIHKLSVPAIDRHRRAMLSRLEAKMPSLGFKLITPAGFQGPYLVFSQQGARRRAETALAAARVEVTLSDNSIRVSPSVHNSLGDINALIDVLSKT